MIFVFFFLFYFENSSEPTLFKVGSLNEHFEFWMNSIRASEFVINTVVEGYKNPFIDLPENFAIPNRSSACKFKDFVYEAISELIAKLIICQFLSTRCT